MSEANPGLTADPLFVGATRPPMRWGVTYSALLVNGVFTMEVFLLTKNLLTLLSRCPFTASARCSAPAMRAFSISFSFGGARESRRCSRTLGSGRSSSYSPLTLDLPERAWAAPDLVRGGFHARESGGDERATQRGAAAPGSLAAERIPYRPMSRRTS